MALVFTTIEYKTKNERPGTNKQLSRSLCSKQQTHRREEETKERKKMETKETQMSAYITTTTAATSSSIGSHSGERHREKGRPS